METSNERSAIGPERRRFIKTISAGVPLLLGSTAWNGLAASAFAEEAETEEMVSPGEDLMREHGVLKRILLVYEEAIRRLDAKQKLPPEPLADSAQIIRSFIEDYHELLEENHLFPRYRRANRMVNLLAVLEKQHQAGRRLTDTILRHANLAGIKDPDSRRELTGSMRQFVRMYAPHEAREDTVLFPALHEIVSQNEYDSLGEEFEKIEQEQFGEGGFEEFVGRVAAVEKTLGIYDLDQFTPKD